MPKTWERALEKYKYPINLTKFRDAAKYPGWFEQDICPGNWSQTREFEDRFRERARYDREAWYEVVYWKTPGRKTSEFIDHINKSGATALDLWNLCMEYIDSPSRESFVKFKDTIHKCGSPMIATAATFAAFICPARFPIVDRRVLKWAKCNGSLHSGAPDISIALRWKSADVRIHMWPFVESWIDWCRFTAERLTERTERTWRARDVEMAVFTAQRNSLKLNPLCS